MKAAILREKFVNYFAKNGHQVVKSSSIIPAQDPTLLFANAGMNQFKDVFLGNEKRSYNTATTVQKCVRAGGKHNDLDQVGFTDRHLTFFEMLGNFSFGAYFKTEAISFAWTFLTKEIGLPVEKLSVTVHYSDEESKKIWMETIGLPENKIRTLGDEDNFWQMGDTGPCGPCTEIFFDRGPDYDNKIILGQKAERHLEIWNLVFMQYNQKLDGSREELSQKGVDTGMGLERLAMVMQGGEKIYDSDVFQSLINQLEKLCQKSYKTSDVKTQAAFHVVAEHLRCSAMIIADDGKPANDGRGYVLRKIIRRALLFLKKLTPDLTIFTTMVDVLIANLGDAYPELEAKKNTIVLVLTQETSRFEDNLSKGQILFTKFLDQCRQQGSNTLSGEQAFKLFDTYGFPLEVTKIMAQEEGVEVDLVGFDLAMQQQKERSGDNKPKFALDIPPSISTDFVGYQTTQTTTKISFIQQAPEEQWFITDKSPFFAACGGQVTDQGQAKINGKNVITILDVRNVETGPNQKAIAHKISTDDVINLNDEVELIVNSTTRANTAKNHTATHLLQAALRQIVNPSCEQAGSLVHPDYLRFDFSHDQALTPEQIQKVELLINSWIWQNHSSKIVYTTLEEANKLGAMALFGEKYNPETVRVVTVGDFSAELCGGTHLKHTGEIGCFKITSEAPLGVGVRRIVALTGPKALEAFQISFASSKAISEMLACKIEEVNAACEKLQAQSKELFKENKLLKQAALKTLIDTWKTTVDTSGKHPLFFITTQNQDADGLKMIANDLINFEPTAIAMIINDTGDTKNFFLMVGKKCLENLSINTIKDVLKKLGLQGGGAANFMQGKCPNGMDTAMLKSALVAL